MARIGAAWWGAAALLLGGCYDQFATVKVVNNSGRPVELLEGGREDPRRVAPGATSKQFTAWGEGRRLDVRSGGCVYQYRFPEMGVNFPWRKPGGEPDYDSRYPVKVQLEPDFSLQLQPQDSFGPAPGSVLKAAQAHGFPLEPVRKTCG